MTMRAGRKCGPIRDDIRSVGSCPQIDSPLMGPPGRRREAGFPGPRLGGGISPHDDYLVRRESVLIPCSKELCARQAVISASTHGTGQGDSAIRKIF